ncbi:hypothetical protein WJX72_005700 [[Myrmecia] bisecta]|uniref:RNA-editing substrate-binding complex 6 protein domain-containing protein n=1 Tax=[Myrmecia] bisecta TaxID=41462 RepID=A0AAW1P2N5_9CHLO
MARAKALQLRSFLRKAEGSVPAWQITEASAVLLVPQSSAPSQPRSHRYSSLAHLSVLHPSHAPLHRPPKRTPSLRRHSLRHSSALSHCRSQIRASPARRFHLGQETSIATGAGPAAAAVQAPPTLTDLQNLLQKYKQNIGSVGTAVSQLTQALLVRRKGQTSRAGPLTSETADSGVANLQRIQDSNLAQLSAAVAGLVAADERPTDEFLQLVARQLHERLASEFDGDAVSGVLQGLAAFGYQPSLTLIEALSAVIRTNIQACQPPAITRLMGAYAVFGHANTGLLGAVAGEVMRRVNEFPGESLSDVLWGCAMLGYHHPRLVDSITQRCLHLLRDMPPAVLSQLVCGLAVLEHKDAVTDVFLDAVSDEAIRNINRFGAADMANLLWAYASLGHSSRIDADLMDGFIYRMLKLHQELDAKGLVNLVWSIAKVDHHSRWSSQLLEAVSSEALQHMANFTPEQLARLLWAFAALRHYSEPLYTAAARCALDKLDAFDASDLAGIMLAYGSAVHAPGPLLQPLQSAIMDRLDDMDGHALSSVLWASGVLGTLTPQTFEATCLRLAHKPLQEFEPQDFEKVFAAELMLEAECEAIGRQDVPRLPAWIRLYAFRAWQDRMYLDRSVSPLQQEVCRSLVELGINFELEKRVEDGCLTVDIVLRIGGRPKTAMKVEPPGRFSTNKPFRPLADAVVAKRLLAAQGWTIISLATHEWKRSWTQAQKAAYLQQRLADAHAAPAELPAGKAGAAPVALAA